MSHDRSESAKRLFHEALEQPADEREGFVRVAAAGDSELRNDVLALLTAQARADAALPPTARSQAAMVLTPGTRLGVYEIHHLLGVGGMGEVYHAHDTKLRRNVAIKVLPPNVAHDRGRLRRFEREAQVLASLNHPHIAAIYGFEDAGDTRALVLELVDGPTLADRVAAGAIPIAETLAIARQIAEALDAAHERGIVHRDLKPANIKLTADGIVKVLDFGLAKIEATGSDLAESPTITAIASREDVIAGTAPYMSPEQARGKVVDKRGDIWAFGCVLFELLTGRRAFGGDSTAEVLAAIVSGAPEWPALPTATPPSVRRLLVRCLEKDPKRRLRDIGDARLEIDEAEATPTAVAGTHVPTRSIVMTAAMATLATAIIATAVGYFRSSPAPGSQEVRVHRLTDWAGLEESPAISPDGQSVAFVARSGGSRQIWRRLLAGGAPLQLTRDARENLFPRWSPDSNAIVFFTPGEGESASGAISEVSALGGTPRRLADAIGEADVSHDGTRLAFFRFEAGRLELVVSARDGGRPRVVTGIETGYYYLSPRWSPDDRRIAYYRTVTNAADIFVVEASGGTPRRVTNDATVQEGLSWSPDGSRLVFGSARGATIRYLPTTNLWSVAVDGSAIRQLTFGEAPYSGPDVSANGTIVASRWRLRSDVWRIPADRSPVENVAGMTRVTERTSQVFAPSVAPDGDEVAFVSDTGGHANIWVHTLATGESRQITFEQDPDVQVGLPLWSPQPNDIAYFTARQNSLNYWMVSRDGSSRRLLAADAGWATWSPDGEWLYFAAQPGANPSLKKIHVSRGTIVEIRKDAATKPSLSPDGRTLYFVIDLPVWNGGADYEIRAATPENGPSRLLARIPDRRMPRMYAWQPVVSPDGRWLLLALVDDSTTNFWALSTESGELRQLTDFRDRRTDIVRRASWGPDRRSIFAALGESDADIVLLEGLRYR